MCRLSVVIPNLSAPESFEDTLVSVLQNRPTNCEIIVVHRGPYEDPYDLRDEVRFIEVTTDATVVAAINAGLIAARGEVVHLLRPGVLASEGWTTPALARFVDPRLGAVAPVLLRRSQPGRIVAAGLRFSAGGAAVWHGRTARSSAAGRLARSAIAGPILDAAFYRKSAVMALAGLSETAGEQLADADLALRLNAAGWDCVVEPACLLLSSVERQLRPLSFAAGRAEVRLFRRYVAAHGMFPAVLFHLVAATGRWLTNAYRWGAYTHVLGRLVTWLERRPTDVPKLRRSRDADDAEASGETEECPLPSRRHAA